MKYQLHLVDGRQTAGNEDGLAAARTQLNERVNQMATPLGFGEHLCQLPARHWILTTGVCK